jgi:hypothetical protein
MVGNTRRGEADRLLPVGRVEAKTSWVSGRRKAVEDSLGEIAMPIDDSDPSQS